MGEWVRPYRPGLWVRLMGPLLFGVGVVGASLSIAWLLFAMAILDPTQAAIAGTFLLFFSYFLALGWRTSRFGVWLSSNTAVVRTLLSSRSVPIDAIDHVSIVKVDGVFARNSSDAPVLVMRDQTEIVVKGLARGSVLRAGGSSVAEIAGLIAESIEERGSGGDDPAI